MTSHLPAFRRVREKSSVTQFRSTLLALARSAADVEGPYYQPGAPNTTAFVCSHSPALDRLVRLYFLL